MSGPKPLSAPATAHSRPPAVAGLFYPDDPESCRSLARQFVDGAPVDPEPAGRRWIGGIVPHAGWVCSGAIAGQTIAAIRRSWISADAKEPELIVVFGAVHSAMPIEIAALDSHSAWEVPGGESAVSEEVRRYLSEGAWFGIDDRFHAREHAVEVELPLIQHAWPGAAILPVEVPVIEMAGRIGIETFGRIAASGLRAIYLASSDLTHYGPAYGFTPAGIGPEALAWAKDNDRKLLEIVTDMRFESVVPEVWRHNNACGGGAIAAMLAACGQSGANTGRVLRHANSSETLAGIARKSDESAVGYASVVVG